MIAEKTGATMHPDMPIAQARAVLDRLHIPYESSWGAGRLMKEVYDEKVQHDVVGPVFCIDYPREVSPLARVHRDDPAYVERFELIVAGFELCNAYSEQNDPAEQLAAFEAEARAKQGGDPEAGDVDHDYIRALEHGMPPTGGLGIGIDRLVMLLASVDSIREVILFPTLRPEFAPPPGGGPGGAPRPLAAPTPIAPGSVAGPSVDGAAPTSVVALPSMAPSVHTITPPEPRELHQRAVRTIAGLTALCGVLQLLSMVPFVHSRFGAREDAIGPLWVPIVGHVVSVIVGLLLILLADQLGKRKHAAWRVGVALFAVGALAHLLKGPHPIALAFCVGMLVALVAYRRSFRAPVDPPSLFRLVRFVPLYLVAVLVFGVVALWTERGRITPGLSIGGVLETVFGGLVGLDGPYTFRSPIFAVYFPAALVALGVVGLVVFAVLLFRPLAARTVHTEDDWDARHAPRAHLRLGHAGLLRAARRQELLLLPRRRGVPRLHLHRRLRAGLRRPDRRAGVGGGRARRVPRDVRGAGLDPGAARRPRGQHAAVRVARVLGLLPGRRGDHRLPPVLARGCAAQEPPIGGPPRRARAPLPAHRGVERLGPAGRPAQRDQRALAGQEPGARLHDVAVAGRRGAREPTRSSCCAWPCARTGRRRGFLRLVPAYGPSFGYTLDLMRHDPDAPNGMTEFLIASTAAALRDRGVARLSMNFAMWGRLFADDVPFTATQRAARWAVGRAQPVLPDQVAARLQREVRPRVAAPRARLPPPHGPAPGRTAVRRRRGLPRPAGDRGPARAQDRRRGEFAVRAALGTPGSVTDHRPYDPLIDTLGNLSITAWWPVRVVVLALGAVAVLAAVRVLRRPASPGWCARSPSRRPSCSRSSPSGASSTPTTPTSRPSARRSGTSRRSPPSAGGVDGRIPAKGQVVPLTVPPTASNFSARQAQVYLPPAWFATQRPALPVVMLMHGEPGDPSDWADGGEAAATADAWAAQHRGVAPVLVMPDINGSLTADTECVDSPVGNAETYLTVDVPAAVQQRFGTTPPGRSWALAGLSEGGACAIMLALRHPDLFSTFGDFGGLSGPRVGESDTDTDPTVAELFGGSRQEFAAHEPADLLATGKPAFRTLGGWFEVGGDDGDPLAAAQRAGPARRRGGHLHLPDRRPGRRAHLRRLERRLPPVTAVDGGTARAGTGHPADDRGLPDLTPVSTDRWTRRSTGTPADPPTVRGRARGIVMGVGQRARQTGRRNRDDHHVHPLRHHRPLLLHLRRRHRPPAAGDHRPPPRRVPGPRPPRPRPAPATAARSSTPPGCGPVASPPPPSPRSSPWSAPS